MMAGTKVKVTYYGKDVRLNPKTRKIIRHRREWTINHCEDNWKDYYAREFRAILDKFKGINEIRFKI